MISEQHRLWLSFLSMKRKPQLFYNDGEKGMFFCYVDESGDSGTLQLVDKNSNPFFIVAGLIVNHRETLQLTRKFLAIKKQFFPDYFKALKPNCQLDAVLQEIKGSDIRKNIRSGNKRRWQQSIGYLDACFNLLEQHNVRLLVRALVKNPAIQNDDASFYGKSMMFMSEHFNMFLRAHHTQGIIIADSRKTAQNTRTSHTIFTQRHKATGNSYPDILEMPSYGHSNNFAMLQLTDTVCSAIIFPMICDVFNTHLHNSGNVHLSPEYTTLRNRYKKRVQSLQYMYQNEEQLWRGGLLILDKTPAALKTSAIFR